MLRLLSEFRSTDNRQPTTDHSSTPSLTDSPPLRSGHASQASLPSVPLQAASAFRSLITDNSATTALPEIVARALPSLRCTTGSALRIERPDGITVHVAFFEWDQQSSASVLEAFKHLPEECMGSIGMTLVKSHPPRTYEVEALGLDRGGAGIVDRGSQIADDAASSSDPKSTIVNQQFSIFPSSTDNRPRTTDNPSPPSSTDNRQRPTDYSSTRSSTDHSISFDHTEFRDPVGRPVHAFKGIWVSGAVNLLGDELRGGVEEWNQLRWRAAIQRFRPAHARVAQGAVRGIASPDRAWEIFEESMLRDLTFTR